MAPSAWPQAGVRRYQVKFKSGGGWTYGMVRQFGPEAERAKLQGMAVVDDAVLPRAYLVPDAELVDIPLQLGHFNRASEKLVGCDELHEHRQTAFEAARRVSSALPDDGTVAAGALFSVQVADGYAWYVVAKLFKKSCRVELRGFAADSYQDHHFGLGGTFPVASVLRYVQRERAMQRHYGQQKTAAGG
jgi:hypothetical protein